MKTPQEDTARFRAFHEAMRPMMVFLEAFANEMLNLESAPELCQNLLSIVASWHAAEAK